MTNRPSRPANSPRPLLFLERFVREHFAQQHPAIRGFVYVLFAVLLAYSIYQTIGGEASIRGRLFISQCVPRSDPAAATAVEAKLQSAPDSDCEPNYVRRSLPAHDFDVLVGDKRFGINLDGDYYVILGRGDHMRLMTRGVLPLSIYNRDASFHEDHRIRFRRWEQSLETVTLPSKATLQASFGGRDISSPGPRFAFGTAWAEQAPIAYGKVFLYLSSVTLAAGDKRLEQGTWSVQIAGTEYPLMQAEKGATATPLVSGQAVDLGRRFYFSLPMSPKSDDGSLNGVLMLQSDAGFLSTYTEKFQISKGAGFDVGFAVHGQRGSDVSLYMSLPFRSGLDAAAKSKNAVTCAIVTTMDECHRSYPSGCGTTAGKYDAYSNYLRNQVPPPAAPSYRLLGALEFSGLDARTPLVVKGAHADQAELLASLGEGTIVATIGYLTRVSTGSRESANCLLAQRDANDIMLHVGFDPGLTKLIGVGGASPQLAQSSMVAEMTPHFRALFRPGWNAERLAGLVGRQVKIVGQLMLDSEHHNPQDSCGYPEANLKLCWRATAWEIHPVTQLYVCKQGRCEANSAQWEPVG
jgi:hypothetical protein